MEKQKEEIDEEIETYVNSVFIERIPVAKNILQDIKKETINYTILRKVKQNIENGWPDYKNQLI